MFGESSRIVIAWGHRTGELQWLQRVERDDAVIRSAYIEMAIREHCRRCIQADGPASSTPHHDARSQGRCGQRSVSGCIIGRFSISFERGDDSVPLSWIAGRVT